FNTNERQSVSNPAGMSAGYCDTASGADIDCDSKTDPNYTHDLLVSALPTTTINGVKYYEFFLDINEPTASNKNYITLDQLEIFQSNTASLYNHDGFGLPVGNGTLAGATSVYQLDGPGQDNWINLDYSLIGGGSG